MKKTAIIVAVLLVLVAIWYFFVRPMGGSSAELKALEFAFKDTASITRIDLRKVIKEEEKSSISLVRDAERAWVIEGGAPVMSARIKTLLSTVSSLQREQTLSTKGKDKFMELIKKNHTEVKIYSGEELVRHYFIGPVNKDHTGNIMLLKGEDEPFIMSRAGMKGYVSIHYSPELLNWKENRLWDLRKENLAYIAVSRKDGKNYSFTRDGEAWRPDFEGADPMKVESYLGWYRGKVNAESWAGEKYPETKDTLSVKEPDIILHYKTTSNEEDKVILYLRPENPDSYFGWKESDDELLTIQHFVIDKYLPSVDYFLAEPL